MNTQVTVLLTAAWPVIYGLAEFVKRKVSQVPNDLTGLFAAVIGVAYVLAVFAATNTNPDWFNVAEVALLYGLSHAGAFEVTTKTASVVSGTSTQAPEAQYTVMQEPPDTGLKAGVKSASK